MKLIKIKTKNVRKLYIRIEINIKKSNEQWKQKRQTRNNMWGTTRFHHWPTPFSHLCQWFLNSLNPGMSDDMDCRWYEFHLWA